MNFDIRNDDLYQSLSDNAKDFIARTLDKDPNTRASASDLLEHPWLEEFREQKIPMPEFINILDNRKATNSSDDEAEFI